MKTNIINFMRWSKRFRPGQYILCVNNGDWTKFIQIFAWSFKNAVKKSKNYVQDGRLVMIDDVKLPENYYEFINH
jgi:hypothetical protein